MITVKNQLDMGRDVSMSTVTPRKVLDKCLQCRHCNSAPWKYSFVPDFVSLVISTSADDFPGGWVCNLDVVGGMAQRAAICEIGLW